MAAKDQREEGGGSYFYKVKTVLGDWWVWWWGLMGMMITQYEHTQYHSSAAIKMAEMVSFTLHMFCHVYKTDKETKTRCFHPNSFLLKSSGCDLSDSQASLLTCCSKLLSQATGLLCSLLYPPLKCSVSLLKQVVCSGWDSQSPNRRELLGSVWL